ncbi:PTS system, glucose-specific IIA subunit [Granulibacter bethesdensis]|uniref:phosphoenolpyruvate--protein phosphotransferase n=2 Tax=Granulibacter bethesdensis TaxID=364410 RepID=A0AAC9KCS1_9PROT|nr:PTS system, glucose-specific IIA subunit [Granulibacter bethesdensis]APH61226.1 PTS system, glucose-specific IIA subunit [Granulibacter bethesdensis]
MDWGGRREMNAIASAQTAPRAMVRVGAAPADKQQAIEEVAQLLAAAGHVDPAYTESMLKRENVANTWLGHGVVIPHGMVDDRAMVRSDGIAVLQVPEGVLWNPGQIAHLVVGIAARSDAHIAILRRLTRLLQDEERLKTLFQTGDATLLQAALSEDAHPAAVSMSSDTVTTDLRHHFEWSVPYPSGLHARPASAWAETAKRFRARLQISHNAEIADPRQLIGLLQLGLKQGDRITVSADGDDAEQALQALKSTMDSLTAGERAAAEKAMRAARPVAGWTPPHELMRIDGVSAAPGLAIGPVYVLKGHSVSVTDHPQDLREGADRLNEALRVTRAQLHALSDDAGRRLGAADAAIFQAQAGLLDDTDLITRVCQLMVDGHGAAWAWHHAVEQTAEGMAALGNPVLAARAADLRDVGRRVLAQLDPSQAGGSLLTLPDYPCILVADDLAPSDTAGLDPARVLGLITALGGPTSHTAILARTLGLPAIAAAGPDVMELPSGSMVILDGRAGVVHLHPDETAIASAQDWSLRQTELRNEEAAQRSRPARTTDGHHVTVAANVNRPDQVAFALEQGGEGVGLMRTEFLFLERDHAPDEEEQFETYRAMLEALDGRPLVVRALDIGGDKQVPHLNLPHEENPFLGVRGARLLLRRPDLLEPQLRALYRAAGHVRRWQAETEPAAEAPLSIMFPMITSLAEIAGLRAVCDRVRTALQAPEVPLGIMVEVPAAALLADRIAPHVDFFSIGTNDLTQYALAMDRQNSGLAAEVDGLHPAVLALIRRTAEAAAPLRRWVGVCGGLAGDPFGAALLAGLGVTELSMTPRDIPGVKACLRQYRMDDLKALAERALAASSPAEVRALETGFHADTGFGEAI